MKTLRRDNDLLLTFEPRWDEIAPATDALLAFLETQALDPTSRYATELVFDEIVPNIIRYGGPRPSDDQIDVAVRVNATHVLLEFGDGGQAFDPHDAPPPPQARDLAEATVGGFGLHLVKAYAERQDYERRGERNHLTVRVRRQPS